MGGYLAYTEYKDSGVEWLNKIPFSWNLIPLKFLVTTRKGIAFKSSDFIDTGCKVVKASDIKNNTILDSSFFIDESFRSLVSKAILKEGEIVISTVGSTPDVKNSAVGQVGIVPKYLNESLLNQNTVVFSPRFSNFIQNKFLFYVLISTPYRDHLDLHAHGTANQASLNITDMLNFQIALPSIEEQRSIARFLDYKTAQIDALIAKKEALLAKLAEKRTALISQAVTKGCDRTVPMKNSGIEWLGEIPAHWEVTRLRFLTHKIEQGWSPSCDSRQADFEEWGVLKAGCVNGEEFDENENKALPSDMEPKLQYEIFDGDILMSRANTKELLGSAAIAINPRRKLLLCDKLYRLSVDENTSRRYLIRLLRSSVARFQYEQEATGSSGSMQNIGQDTIKDLIFPIPPFNEQELISGYLDKTLLELSKIEVTIKQAIAKLKEYRTALITNAVTGKIDVRDVKLPELDSMKAA